MDPGPPPLGAAKTKKDQLAQDMSDMNKEVNDLKQGTSPARGRGKIDAKPPISLAAQDAKTKAAERAAEKAAGPPKPLAKAPSAKPAAAAAGAAGGKPLAKKPTTKGPQAGAPPKVDNLSESELTALKEKAQQTMMEATKAAAAAMAQASKLSAAHNDLLTPLSPLNMSGDQLISPRQGAATEAEGAPAAATASPRKTPAADEGATAADEGQ